MLRILKKSGRKILKLTKLEVTRNKQNPFPEEIQEFWEVIENIKLRELSMVSNSRLFATAIAAKYICENKIDGDFVECGVWRGGNSILAASIFQHYKQPKQLHLYDTFSGMTRPTSKDYDLALGQSAINTYNKLVLNENNEESDWCRASIEEVKGNFIEFGLELKSTKFIRGDVLQTLQDPTNVPDKISILRLDTDWYESTKFELETLYPKLVIGGVLIVDDYGHWSGARQAVDEYFKDKHIPLLNIIDYTGRMAIKTYVC
jgi:hypothetical protein